MQMSPTRRKRRRGRGSCGDERHGSEKPMSGSEGGEKCLPFSAADVHTLYDLLGVSKDASPREITIAYRRRALMCHPDKVRSNRRDKTGDQCSEQACSVEEATKHFQKLQAAYSVLSDPQKRQHYDRTGQTDAVGLSGPSYEEAYDFYRGMFEEVTEESIEKFKSNYIGSQEERDDIRDYYNRHGGDLSRFFQYVPFSDPCDIPRYRVILQRLLKDKTILETGPYKKTLPKFESYGSKYTKMVEKEMGDDRIPKSKKQKTDTDASALILAIKVAEIQANVSRRRASGTEFLHKLEKKYSKEKG